MGSGEEVIDLSDKGVHTIDESGVRSGLNMIPFHWEMKSGNQHGPFFALGKRNLEFRRSEAETAGASLVSCDDGNCNHTNVKEDDGGFNNLRENSGFLDRETRD